MVRGIRPALLILTAVVAIVLLIALVNLTNLLLARGAERRRELAIRAAIGAGRMRLVRQLLTESLLLAAAGAAAGLGLAWTLQRALPALAPDNFPRIEELSLDTRVLAFTLAVTVISALLFGSAPALQALRLSLTRALGEAGYSSSSGLRFVRGNRTRLTLAIGEVAMALVLLVGAGLLARSFARLIDVNPGYDPANVLTTRLTLPPSTYSGERAAQFYDALLEKVSALPDVAAAGTIGTLPLSPGLMMVAFDLPSRGTDAGPATAGIRIVSPGYLAAMGLRLVEGRFLADTDRSGSRPVVVVNEAFVRAYFPGESLIGRELPLSRTPSEVVGIVGDVRHTGLDSAPQPEVYVAYRQSDQVRASAAYLVVRATRDPMALVPALRAVVRSIDPDIPLESVMTMEARLSASVAQPRFYAVLLGGFAALALALAIVGVYGVLAYSVRQRRREIGVRMAVGADAENIVRLVMRQGAAMIAAGLAAGLAAAFVTSKAVSTLLFGVTARDPMVFAAAVVVLGGVGLLACYLPARSAARIDPLEVLRSE
jgi:putative ABC transport system permease protein